jgi:plastocyanin
MLALSKTERACCLVSSPEWNDVPVDAKRGRFPMRKLMIAFAALAALAVAGPAGAGTRTVSIYGYGFSPKSVTITEGDTVTWVNRDNENHQVLATKGQFVSAILRPKQKFSFTFHAPGTYAYKDELHPKHTGKIVVKGLPPTLTMTASAPIVDFGTKATLSGVVSSHQAGEQVTIYYQPYPQPNLIQRAVLLTSTGGAFSFVVGPQVLTTYEAAWKGAFATPTTIQVRPHLSIGRNGAWILHAAGGRAAAERPLLGARQHQAPQGNEPPAPDDVRQPGGRRLPRCDRADVELAADLGASPSLGVSPSRRRSAGRPRPS